MSATHTPGPWSAIKGIKDGDEMRCGVVCQHGKMQYLIATIENGGPGDFCETEEANAKLMAAAPEFLVALQEIADHPGPHACEAAGHRVAIARAALAKACAA